MQLGVKVALSKAVKKLPGNYTYIISFSFTKFVVKPGEIVNSWSAAVLVTKVEIL